MNQILYWGMYGEGSEWRDNIHFSRKGLRVFIQIQRKCDIRDCSHEHDKADITNTNSK